MTRLVRRVWEEMTLTPPRPLIMVLFVVAAAATALPEEWGDVGPSVVLTLAVLVGVREFGHDRAMGKRRWTPYPSTFSQAVRGVMFALLGFLSLVIAFGINADGLTTVAMGFAGVLSLCVAFVYALALRRPAIRRRS
jgi:hypothetical protein